MVGLAGIQFSMLASPIWQCEPFVHPTRLYAFSGPSLVLYRRRAVWFMWADVTSFRAKLCGSGTPLRRTLHGVTTRRSCRRAPVLLARLWQTWLSSWLLGTTGAETCTSSLWQVRVPGSCLSTRKQNGLFCDGSAIWYVCGPIRRLWVVDDAKKPIGVISLTDLINAVIDRMDTVKVIGD